MSTTTSIAVPAPVNAFASRQEQARLACESAGIVWPKTILPEGTALYDIGVEKLKSDRAAWRRLPLASEVIGLVHQALREEAREDYPTHVGLLRLRQSDGRIVKPENLENSRVKGLGYNAHSLRQLVAQIDPLDDAPRGFANALVYLSDQERAEILNKRLQLVRPETKVTLRTRIPHQGSARITRAALSGRYGSVTDFDIAGALSGLMRDTGDSSGRMDYKPGDSASRFEIIWPSEIPVTTFVVGDVHYAMLSITNSETGEGSIRIAPAVVRAACANLTISVGEGTEVVMRHLGSPEILMQRLRKAIRLAIEDVATLVSTITLSAKIEVETWTPEKALQNIAKRYELPQAAAKSWLDQYRKSQYPATVWGMTSAITEAAHQTEDWQSEAEWERVASTVQAKVAEVVVAGTPSALALERALAVN